MQNIKNYIIIAILTLSVIAGIFSNIPLSYAQNDTMSMANMTEEEEEEYATEGGHAAKEKEYNQTSTVRDSVTELLQDKIITGGDFVHLYDSTPYILLNGHVTSKTTCEEDNTTTIQILIRYTPNMTTATRENIGRLSSPGGQ